MEIHQIGIDTENNVIHNNNKLMHERKEYSFALLLAILIFENGVSALGTSKQWSSKKFVCSSHIGEINKSKLCCSRARRIVLTVLKLSY